MKHKILAAFVLISTLAAVCLAGYGLATDCEDAAIYVDCSEI